MAMDYTAAYKTLVTSPHQLALCARQITLSGLLEKIRHCIDQPALTDEDTLAALTRCNAVALESVPHLFDAGWLPYRYDAKTQLLSWCLPHGHPQESFHDQYVDRCRQHCLLNQVVSPRTLLTGLSQARSTNLVMPSGFIFHLSRCGSTLISGCLSEIQSTSVLSESAVLTEILLDNSLCDAWKKNILFNLIDRHARLYAGRGQVIIKWNAWDIFIWPLLRSLYPQVPVVFLVRHPVEILASHQQMAGRHMAADASMLKIDPLFTAVTAGESLLDLQMRVLGGLMERMLENVDGENIMVVDYEQLDFRKITDIASFFRIVTQDDDRTRMRERMSLNSKNSGHIFSSDSEVKRKFFNVQDSQKIQLSLLSRYCQLLTKAGVEKYGNCHA